MRHAEVSAGLGLGLDGIVGNPCGLGKHRKGGFLSIPDIPSHRKRIKSEL